MNKSLNKFLFIFILSLMYSTQLFNIQLAFAETLNDDNQTNLLNQLNTTEQNIIKSINELRWVTIAALGIVIIIVLSLIYFFFQWLRPNMAKSDEFTSQLEEKLQVHLNLIKADIANNIKQDLEPLIERLDEQLRKMSEIQNKPFEIKFYEGQFQPILRFDEPIPQLIEKYIVQ